jgi:hypothetical protein
MPTATPSHSNPNQGSFFWLQNTEGEPVVGGWLQIHQPEVLPPYFVARKKNRDPNHNTWTKKGQRKSLLKLGERASGPWKMVSRASFVRSLPNFSSLTCLGWNSLQRLASTYGVSGSFTEKGCGCSQADTSSGLAM